MIIKTMSCFVAPTAAAIIVAAAKKKIPPKYHAEWLLAMLGGGGAWLIAEHIYQGELVSYPPFLTAGIHEIIPEIITVGIPMVIAVIAIWTIMLWIASSFPKIILQPSVLSLMVFGAALVVLIDKILA